MRKIILFIVACLFIWSAESLQAGNGVIKIVVLGSSTAAGAGPTNSANAWVNQYRQYVKAVNASSEVINLAVGGYTTYHVMPSDYAAPANRPSPNTDHNITKALSHHPDVVIINLPTNDAANNYTVVEQLANYKLILEKATAQNVPVWITTTQPRNISLEQRQNLIAMRDSTIKKYGTKAIDFWTDIATAEGTINSMYDMGDGTHLNDAAHTILKDRVVNTDILTYSRSDNEKDTINVDFGSTLSSNAWNNLNSATQDTIMNLINNQNQGTGISVWIHDAFTGVNTSGTTTPDASLNFPASATSDSFFGSVGAHGGITEPTGGVTLSGLNRNSRYSFTFFASRANATDNRETEYVVTGKTEQKVYLNPANNTANIATVTDMAPADNGTIIITVGPGPNNNNANKYYFLGAMRITSIKQQVVYDTDGTINIDLGSKLSTGAWNNLTIATGGETLSDLVNSEGNSTGISAWVHDAFTGINEAGTTSPEASLEMSSDATSDSFFGSSGAHSGIIEATGGITLSGLSASSKYSLSFFASRDGVTDNREAQYKVTGKTVETVLLNASNNKKDMVTVADMKPADDGTITVEASPGPNNTNSLKYYYLGAIRIKYGPTTGVANKLNSAWNNLSTSVYPNPFNDEVTFSCDLPEAGEIQIKIYNISGQLLKVLSSGSQSNGKYSVKWDGTNNNGTKLNPGLYVSQISLLAKHKIYSHTQKLIIE